MERFKIIRPSEGLAPYIKHYWILESDNPSCVQRIIPIGSVELLFHRACQMIKNGSEIPRTSISGQTFHFADLVSTGAVNMIVVVFRPFGAKAFFDIPIYELSGNVVSSEDINVKALADLEDKILNTFDNDICINLIESFLFSRLNPFKEYNYKRMLTAVNTINTCGGEISVSSLAEKVCLSNKQFNRIFNEHIGAKPKEFMRIVRFHKALFILQNNLSMNFTNLAYECGYYDQSHMTKEFKLFSGYSPSEYVSVCDPYSDYFSL